jgi:hypothetical protein
MGVQGVSPIARYPRPLTDALRADIAARWSAGESNQQIAADLDTTAQQVAGVTGRLKGGRPLSGAPIEGSRPTDSGPSPITDRPLSESEAARARLLDAEGLSADDIAERIGVTATRVRDALGPPSFLADHLPAADRPDQHPRIDGPPGAEPPVTTSSGDGAAVDVKPSAGHTSPEVTSEAGHRNGSVPTAEQFDDVASESADPLPMDAGSEYGRLLAERDQLIAGGVDPAELVVPLPPGRGHVAGPSPVAAADPEPPATHRVPIVNNGAEYAETIPADIPVTDAVRIREHERMQVAVGLLNEVADDLRYDVADTADEIAHHARRLWDLGYRILAGVGDTGERSGPAGEPTT